MLSSQSGLVSLAEAAVGTYNGSKRNTHTCCQSLHGVQGALLGMPHVDFHLAMWQYHWKLQLRPSLQVETLRPTVFQNFIAKGRRCQATSRVVFDWQAS
jgi:hypothetical protein